MPSGVEPGHGGLRFAFYGRASTEDWQDPMTSRARQRDQAQALVARHGQIAAEFFDIGQSRPWPGRAVRRPLSLSRRWLTRTAGWDAVVIGEYERAFYGSQYASMAPLFEHYGIQLCSRKWAGGSTPGLRITSR